MRRLFAILTAILVGAVIWFFFQHFRIEGAQALRVVPKSEQELNEDPLSLENEGSSEESPSSIFSFPNLELGKGERNGPSETTLPQTIQVSTDVSADDQAVPPEQDSSTIRIASFHLMHFGSKVENPTLRMNAVARVVRLFDIVALQGVSPTGEAAVIDLAKKAGPSYSYLLSKGGGNPQEQRFAFVYNKSTIVADRGEGLYTLGDPDNLLRRDPLIGWFKTKRPADDEAFTFSLVNVHVDRRHVVQELNVLDNVIQEVRNDWRDEDDVILLGCFHRDESGLEELGQVRGIIPTVRGVATTLQGNHQTENLIFRGVETDEFDGRSGVYHFLRAFNLDMDQASQVSEFLPVWAEFSIYEGGQQGRVAENVKPKTLK